MKLILYKTTNILTGMFYVGKHQVKSSLEEDTYLGSGLVITRAIRKYGKENFIREILCIGSQEYIEMLEEAYVDDDLLLDPLCMNLARGGQGGRGPSLCRTPESYKLSHAKSRLKRLGRTKETDAGCRSQSQKMLGRNKNNDAGFHKLSVTRSKMIGELAGRSKLTDHQRDIIYRLHLLGFHVKKLHELAPQLTLSGLKTAIARKSRKLLTVF